MRGSTADGRKGHDDVAGQRRLLVRQRQEVQALPQRRPCCTRVPSARWRTVPAGIVAPRLRRDRHARCAATEADGEIARRHRAHARRRSHRTRRAATRPGRPSRPASPPTSSTASRTKRTSRAACTRARSTTSGFPKSVCTSVNEVICHGIPDDRRSSTATSSTSTSPSIIDGVHGDTNATFLRRARRRRVSKRLVRVTEECLDLAIEAVRPGAPVSRHRARDRGARARRRASSSCAPSSATASARCSTGHRRCRTTTSARPPRSWSRA